MEGFVNQQDVSHKLHNTICFFKGEPVYVSVNRENRLNEVTISYLNGSVAPDKRATVNVTDKEFRNGPYNLGYVNMYEYAAYVVRSPYRQYKFGLCSNALNLKKKNNIFSIRDVFPFGMRQLLLNIYPTPKEAEERIYSDQCSAVAFDRNYAFKKVDERVLGLYYKESLIATKTTRTAKFELMHNLPYVSFHIVHLRNLNIID